MNYNLSSRRETSVAYDVDENRTLPSGILPVEMLTAKFEITEGVDPMMYEDDGRQAAFEAYDHHARGLLTDWTPDERIFEHEETRKSSTIANAAHLNLRYEGHRGVEEVDNPELFLGFLGGEDREMRGIATDPDMKKYRQQSEARSRFHRFTKDHQDTVTGGGRSEFQAMQDKQKVFRRTRQNLKIFSRTLDGRAAGESLVPNSTNETVKHVRTQNSRGENDKDLHGRRNVNNTLSHSSSSNQSGRLTRDTREYRSETDQASYNTINYRDLMIQRGGVNPQQASATEDRSADRLSMNSLASSGADGLNGSLYSGDAISDSDNSAIFRTAAQAMKQIVNAQYNADAKQREFGAEATPSTRKTASMTEAEHVLRRVIDNTKYATSDEARNGRNSSAVKYGDAPIHLSKLTVEQHFTPPHILLNAEIIRKSAGAPKEDRAKINVSIITNHMAPEVAEGMVATRRGERQTNDANRITRSAQVDQDATDTAKTMSYSTKKNRASANSKQQRGSVDGALLTDITANSQARRPGASEKAAWSDNTSRDMSYGILSNAQIDRRLSPMGSKYTAKHSDYEKTSFGDKLEMN